VSAEVTTAGTWEAADDPDVKPAWSIDPTSTKSPYGTPENQAPVTVQRTATESRYAKVSRNSEGEILGVALILNETELCRLGAELDRAEELKYWVEGGRLRFTKADAAEKERSPSDD